MKLQAPKGTRDFYPAEMALRNWIFHHWQDVSRRNGFVEYDGPIFEDLELYRVKSGDEIVSQLFHFEDRGGRQFAIRPEMTPTLARMAAARANTLGRPIKWFSVPRLCRAERPQRGRLREFFQWNIDIIGEDSEVADAECVFVAIDFFRAVGLSPENVVIKINSRAIVSSLLRTVHTPDEKLPAVFSVLDKRDKMPAEAFAETVAALGLADEQQRMLIEMGEAKGPEGFDRVERLLADDEVGAAQCQSLRRVFAMLDAMQVAPYCVYDMGVVRGLAYYTGMVFEAFGTGGLRRALCGGGRYDRLLSDLDGPPLGAVGFATSDVVIQDLLTELGMLPAVDEQADFFVIDADPNMFDKVLHIVGQLRGGGASALFSYKRQPVGKQLKQASSKNAARVVFVEPDHASTGAVTIKDMREGQQMTLSLEAFLADPRQALA